MSISVTIIEVPKIKVCRSQSHRGYLHSTTKNIFIC